MTREEAIKTLHELWRNINDPWYEETYNMAIDALQFQDIMINNPKTVKPTPEVCKNCKDNDWIPVSERLPSEGGFYLCTTEDCVTILEFVMGNYHYNESPSFVSDTLGRCNGYVIAWMPLPNSYKEK